MPKSRTFTKGGPSRPAEEDVLRLEVAVDDAPGVRGLERLADLDEDGQGALGRHGARRRGGERLALQVLHDQVVPPRRHHAHVEDVDDVLVADEVDRARLGVEALHQRGVGREVLVEHLHRDLAADERLLAQVDRAHAAVADPPDEAEAAHRGAQEWIGRAGRRGGGHRGGLRKMSHGTMTGAKRRGPAFRGARRLGRLRPAARSVVMPLPRTPGTPAEARRGAPATRLSHRRTPGTPCAGHEERSTAPADQPPPVRRRRISARNSSGPRVFSTSDVRAPPLRAVWIANATFWRASVLWASAETTRRAPARSASRTCSA